MVRLLEWTLVVALCVFAVALAVRGARDDGGPLTDAPTPAVAVVDEPVAEPPAAAIERTDLMDLGAVLHSAGPLEPAERPTLFTRELSNGLPDLGQWRGSSLLADLDGDDDLDLVSSVRRYDRATPGEGLTVWLGDGAGGWRESIDGLRRDMGYGGSAVGDLDGDGHADLAFSAHDVPPQVFLGDGAGGWRLQPASGIDVTGMCADVALGDVDGDGWCDLAALGFHRDEGGLALFAGVGGGTFVRLPDLLPGDAFGAQVETFDLDGDGQVELAATTSLGPRVWRWRDGALAEWSDGLPAPEIGGSDLGLDAADLDGDGFAELLVTGMAYRGHDPLCVYRWDGEAWRRWGAGLPQDESFFDGVVADLRGDGRPWFVLAGKHGITLVRGDGAGTFAAVGRLHDTEGVFNVAAGDVDGDGRDEIVFVGIGGVRVLRPLLPEGPEGESS